MILFAIWIFVSVALIVIFGTILIMVAIAASLAKRDARRHARTFPTGKD